MKATLQQAESLKGKTVTAIAELNKKKHSVTGTVNRARENFGRVEVEVTFTCTGWFTVKKVTEA